MFSVEKDKEILENNNKKQKEPISNKKIIIIGIVCFVIVLIGLISYNYYQNNYVYLKEDKFKDIVYPIYIRKNIDKTKTEVPKINIKSKNIKKVNSKIYEEMGKFLGEKNNTCTYSYEINGDILSLTIEMIDYRDLYVPEFKFRTYNIDLETLKEVSDNELLDLYDVDKKDIEKIIKNKFKYFYKDELKKGYLNENECNYECFLEWRNVNSYMDNLEYYISDGKLYAYKEFSVLSVYGEDEYYKEEDFSFYISD